jgi:uncharacterized protein (TIGR03437 family)
MIMKALRFTCLLSLVLLTLSVLIFQRTANPGKPAAHQSSSARITAQSLTDQAKRIQLSEAYGKLPLSFEANQGQANSQVKFLARGSGYQLSLTATGAALHLQTPSGGEWSNPNPQAKQTKQAETRKEQSTIVRIKLVNANPAPEIAGRTELPGQSNYFIGNDPTKWRTNVPHYAKVEYREIYPGVSLVYYGNQRQLEYDFIVAPGADPRAIRLSFEGADKIKIDRRGQLALQVAGGELVMQKPLVYQELDGARQEVTGSYVLIGQDVAFQVGEYDAGRPLIIDPILSYSTYLGGGFSDRGYAIAVDAAGNAYVTGETHSANFPLEKALDSTNTARERSAFVTKLNPTGTALVYSTYLGGSDRDSGDDIVVDTAGNVWLTGYTYSTDFPTKNPIQAMHGGFIDVFIAKLNPAGSELVYSTFLGGGESESGQGIAMDAAGAIYVTGATRSVNFPTVNPLQANNAGFDDAFILKLNPAGTAMVYSTYLGGSSGDAGRDIAVDAAGAVHVVGQTSSTNFRTANPLQAALGGSSDAFVAQLNSAGSALVYSTYLGGSSGDEGNGIAVDALGSAYVTGRTDSDNFPTKEPFQATYGKQTDAFLAVLPATGSALVYSTFLGGMGSDTGNGIAVDAQGNVFVTGRTDSTNFPQVNPVQPGYGGVSDAFVARFNSIGSALVFSTYLGGNNSDEGNAIAIDSVGNAYITGETSSTNYPTQNPIQGSQGGVSDAFLTKISEILPPPSPTPTPSPNPTPTPPLPTVRVDRATKTCTPTSAYPRIAAQPAAGPNFAAIPEQPPTQIKCTFSGELVLESPATISDPVNLTIFDGFSPGLFFDRLTASDPPLSLESYTGNVLTFKPISLALPREFRFLRFHISFEYLAFLNELAEQRDPQQNCITLRFTDPKTGRVLLERGGICADTGVLVPRLTLEKYASTTTGLPGDTLKFTVIAFNGGNITLQFVDLDALIPNNTTFVPGSIDPPPTRVVGNRIEWRPLGPIGPRGALMVNYAVTIDANTPEGAKLVDQAFAHAITATFPDAGTRRLNAASNQVSVMVMALRTGIDLTLTPNPPAGCPLTIVDYTARVTNTGQATLDRLRLSLNRGTEPVAGSPTFPLELEPLGPGESRTIPYKGRIGLRQRDILVDVATVVGRPVNNSVQVAELVGKVATATVQVSPPAISKITPASGPASSSNLELKIEGACFVPQTVVSFQANSGIEVIDPTPPDFGFVGTSELRRRINIRADAAPGEREAFVTNPNGMSGGQRPFNVFSVTGALAAIETGTTNLDFANVSTGQSKDLVLIVRNTGQAALIVNPIPSTNPRFSVIAPALPVTMAPGTQQNITVRFAPVAAGPQAGALTLTSNAANSPNVSITLTGSGIGTPDIAVTPETLDFGSVAPGQRGSKTLTFSNAGNGALNIYAITSSNPNFNVPLPLTPFSLPAGGIMQLMASFTPTSVGEQVGTLLISSNAVNKNTLAIQVRGDAPGGQTLTTDDGTVEMGAVQDGLLIVNRLTPPRHPVTLRQLRVFFAQFQGLPSPVGEQIRLVVLADPSGSGQPPANPTLLVNQMVTIPTIPANGGFVDFPITTTAEVTTDSGATNDGLVIQGGDIYVGFQAPRPARGVVFAADSNGPQQQRAFFSTNDGASYAKLTGLQNQQGSTTPVNLMLQGVIGGVGVCTYAISPGSQAFAETGGNGMVTITTQNGCSWAASSSTNWITFPSNSNGAGNGTVNFSVASSTAPRQAVVTIAGQSFIVAQAERVASVSSASYRRLGLASESIAAAYGTALATSVQTATSIPLPTTLAGTTIKVRDVTGVELFAPLFFVSPGQINFLMPPGIAPGTATISVTNDSGGTATGAVLNDSVAPGLFTANADGQGVPAAVVLRVKADGSQSFEPLASLDPQQNRLVPSPIELGPPGEQVFLLLFGTGLRGRSSLAAAKVTFGGEAGQVSFAGAQGDLVGLDQVNVAVPRALAGRGVVNLLLTVDDRVANTVQINIK